MQTSVRQTVAAFAVAATATAVLASVFSTQFVISGLVGIGVDVPLATRLVMTVTDLAMLVTLVPAAAACFLPAFALAGFLSRRLGGSRSAWFTLAGATALFAELLIIQAMLELMPIGGARTLAGLAMQAVAGAFGGWIFARLTVPSSAGEAN